MLFLGVVYHKEQQRLKESPAAAEAGGSSRMNYDRVRLFPSQNVTVSPPTESYSMSNARGSTSTSGSVPASLQLQEV